MVSARCNGYDKDTGACLACSGIFLFNKGKCQDPNCLKESTTDFDKCDLCKDGYAFRNGICRFNDVNCQVIINSTCQQCFDGYSFSSQQNKCVSLSQVQSQNLSSPKNASTSNQQPVQEKTQSVTTNNKI